MTAAVPVVWVVAGRETAESWVTALRTQGCAAGALVWAEARMTPPTALPEADLVLFTSRRAALALPEGAGADRPAACVGAGTASAARARGFDVVLVGEAGGSDLAARILAERPEARQVLFLCGQDARREAPDALRAGGVAVESLPVYAMEPAPDFGMHVARSPEPAAVVLGSPRAADALAEALQAVDRTLPEDAVVVVLGAVTAERATERFGRYVARASSTDADGLAGAVRAALDRSQA